MDQEKLWVALKEMGVPQRSIILMFNLYCGQKATARTEYGETEWVPIGKGVTQGYISSLYLFKLYTGNIL